MPTGDERGLPGGKEHTMPTGEERRLKLVRATPAVRPDGAAQTRQPADGRRRPARRTVTRRVPRAEDPVKAIMERLDEEPVHLDDQPSADGSATADGSARGRRAVTTAVLAALTCVTLALAGVFGYQWYQDRALEQARGQALAAARQTTVNFVSVSASSVDDDLRRIVAGAAGQFKEEFTRGQAQVRAAVVENKVESTGTVLRTGLLSGDRRAAVALVAVDATVKNVHAPDGRVAHYRIQVDLTRDRGSGAWLVSRLQFVG